MDEETPSLRSMIPSDESHKLFECPICVQIFRDPKLLSCGHSICAACCVELCRNRVFPLCPVCRHPTSSPPESWPINFGLRDLVQHHLQTLKEQKFACSLCDRRITADNCWSCLDCRRIVCSHCALKFHQNHALKEINELMREKEAKLIEWRQNLFKTVQQINASNRLIESNQLKLMRTGQHLLSFTLCSKLVPQLRTEEKSLLQESLEVKHRLGDMTAARLINEESNGGSGLNREEESAGSPSSDFDRLPGACQALLAKQSETLKRQTDALIALRQCESTIVALLGQSAQSSARPAELSSINSRDRESTTFEGPRFAFMPHPSAENGGKFGFNRYNFSRRPDTFSTPRNLRPQSSSSEEEANVIFRSTDHGTTPNNARDFEAVTRLMDADADITTSSNVVALASDDDAGSLAARRGSDVDDVDDMDAAPSTSADCRANAVAITTRRPKAPKRIRGGSSGFGTTPSGGQGQTAERSDPEETSNAVGSAIRFRMLSKQSRNR